MRLNESYMNLEVILSKNEEALGESEYIVVGKTKAKNKAKK